MSEARMDWSSHPAHVYRDYKSTVLRRPTKPLVAIDHTLSELTGPVYGHDCIGPLDADLTRNGQRNGEPLGERIIVTGRVVNEDDRPQANTLIEIWQANAAGRYNHPADDRKDNLLDPDFTGFGRIGTGTSADASFHIDTVKPGAVDGRQTPHINVVVLMRGLLTHAFTRLYFSDEEALNAADPVLAQVPEDRRATLIARRDEALTGNVYRFDIHMQGERETVFFDI